VFLCLALGAPSVRAQLCPNSTTAAEASCKSTNPGCANCSDFNFGSDCGSNQREHCAEIQCCPACTSQIQAMWTCEHGSTCGAMSCSSSNPSPPPSSNPSPPPTPRPTVCDHDEDKCEENGGPDDDCTAEEDAGGCADGYTYTWPTGECPIAGICEYSCTMPGCGAFHVREPGVKGSHVMTGGTGGGKGIAGMRGGGTATDRAMMMHGADPPEKSSGEGGALALLIILCCCCGIPIAAVGGIIACCCVQQKKKKERDARYVERVAQRLWPSRSCLDRPNGWCWCSFSAQRAAAQQAAAGGGGGAVATATVVNPAAAMATPQVAVATATATPQPVAVAVATATATPQVAVATATRPTAVATAMPSAQFAGQSFQFGGAPVAPY
jgi:hypothetical protein